MVLYKYLHPYSCSIWNSSACKLPRAPFTFSQCHSFYLEDYTISRRIRSKWRVCQLIPYGSCSLAVLSIIELCIPMTKELIF